MTVLSSAVLLVLQQQWTRQVEQNLPNEITIIPQCFAPARVQNISEDYNFSRESVYVHTSVTNQDGLEQNVDTFWTISQVSWRLENPGNPISGPQPLVPYITFFEKVQF